MKSASALKHSMGAIPSRAICSSLTRVPRTGTRELRNLKYSGALRHVCPARELHQSSLKRERVLSTGNDELELSEIARESSPYRRPFDFKHISLDTQTSGNGGRIKIITIRNSAKLNILSTETIEELQTAFEMLKKTPSIRTVMLTGEVDASRTPSFCAGANIKEMNAIATPTEAKTFIRKVGKLCETIYTWPCPTIARIDGLCFGAGLEIAACFDFRYGTDRSTFSMKEVAIGVPSVVHARLLANIMGFQAAKRMVFFAKVWDADEAYRFNLLDGKFATVEEMDARIKEDIELMVSHGPRSMRAQKLISNTWETASFEQSINFSIEEFGKMWIDGGSEPKTRMQAWIDRTRGAK